VSSRAGVRLSGPARLGGHGWMGSGVKVRAELDRVAALALRPEPIRSTMLGRLPAFSSVGCVPFGRAGGAMSRQERCVVFGGRLGR
jgi:hypothetical protein